MSLRTYQFIERAIVVMMMIGLAAMFQPWNIAIYGLGFHLLLVGTLSFIVFTKFQPQDDGS